MENFPLISVITPLYNQAAFLEETAESLFASDYPHVEWIIVDDGSSDSSPEIASKLADTHSWIHFFSQSNAGPAAARNTAISYAKGTFILPLDADDLISKEYIREAAEVLRRRPEVKAVYCEAEKFGAKTGLWKLKPFSRARLAQGNMIFVSAMYRKRDWQAVGGYAEEMIWGFEDWEFWISMLKDSGEVVKLPLTGFYYRIRGGSRRKSVDQRARQLTYQFINEKHKEFIFRHLKGPIRRSKTWSKPFNMLVNWLGIRY